MHIFAYCRGKKKLKSVLSGAILVLLLDNVHSLLCNSRGPIAPGTLGTIDNPGFHVAMSRQDLAIAREDSEALVLSRTAGRIAPSQSSMRYNTSSFDTVLDVTVQNLEIKSDVELY